jgi:hypothetical protein
MLIELYPGKMISADQAVEIILKSFEMRDMQIEYFQTRDKHVLGAAKLIEREFDKLKANCQSNTQTNGR